MFAGDRASAALGMHVEVVRSGYARVTMTITESMLNGHDIAHGGYVFLLADTAFACACNSGRPTTVAATAEIDFLVPVRLGDQLEAEAIERYAAGRSGITDVRVRRITPEPAVVAEFRGRSRTLRD
ncbi:hydroxyphenylacetyl-CoA thioesterase PaaI [Nitriliruptoraceae bacterium ZYF776]|nr:hydroxyphenylacetyl-CoA thioesterase PaaI [Profundirhabdus halotolerans]